MMKVKEIRKLLDGFGEDDDLCAIIYDKSLFDYDKDDDFELTNEGWSKVVSDFDDASFDDIYNSILFAVIEYSVDKER